MTTDFSPRRHGPAMLALAALLPALGGCFSDRQVSASAYPHDFRERHPITLTNAARALDVFPEGASGLDARQANDLRAYLNEHRRYGDGPIVAQVPVGSGETGSTRQALAAIRASVGGRLAVTSYAVADPSIASPIRLSFRRLQARVSDRCGLWPQDLGVGDGGFSTRNEPYWNYGCALQSNFASQVADPVDLVRGRPETPPDTTRRMQNIAKLRSGTDPSTNYRQDGQNKINTSVAN